MSGKKEVTIGITVTLENYENIRLEVEGDVETHEDVDDLIAFLDGILARLGRGDPATAERVDAYRRRVLVAKPAEQTKAAAEVEPAIPTAPTMVKGEPAQQQKESSCPPVEVIETAIPPAPEQPQPANIPKPPETSEEKAPIAQKPEPDQKQAPEKPEQTEGKPAAAPAGDVCELCGAEVTKSQAKLSQLFMSKTLCKKCMEQP